MAPPAGCQDIPRLVAITPDDAAPADLLDTIREVVAAGCPAVQLRRRRDTARELQELARAAVELAAGSSTRILINDRVDVALGCRADGVHLPEAGLSTEQARDLLGRNLPGQRTPPDRRPLIGRSTHSTEAPAGALPDFLQFGPVFATPSKAAFGPPQGLDRLRALAAESKCPVVAVGGITRENAASVCAAGAHGIAVIRAVFAADRPGRVVKEFLDVLGVPDSGEPPH